MSETEPKGNETKPEETKPEEGKGLVPVAELAQERKRRQELEGRLEAIEKKAEEERRERELKEAKTADELATTMERHKAEMATREAAAAATERRLELERDAAVAGVNANFLAGADDGESPVADVVAKAKEAQEAFLKESSENAGKKPVGGGSSPGAEDGPIWKESDVAALSPKEYMEKKEEIAAARRAGRFLAGQ